MTGTLHDAAVQWSGSYKIGVKSTLEYSAVRIQCVFGLIFLFFLMKRDMILKPYYTRGSAVIPNIITGEKRSQSIT